MFYGDEILPEEAKARLSEVYKLLKDSPAPRKIDTITLRDLLLISMVCNRMYGTQVAPTNPSGYYRLTQGHKILEIYLKELGEHLSTLHLEIASPKSTEEGREALVLQGTSVVLKMLFVCLEAIVAGLDTINPRPYGITGMIERALDKAWLKRNSKVRRKPDNEKGNQ